MRGYLSSITCQQQLIVNATGDLFCLCYKNMSYQTDYCVLYLNTRKHILIACDSQECVKIQETVYDCQMESLFSSANMNAFAKINEDRKMT